MKISLTILQEWSASDPLLEWFNDRYPNNEIVCHSEVLRELMAAGQFEDAYWLTVISHAGYIKEYIETNGEDTLCSETRLTSEELDNILKIVQQREYP